MSGDELPEHDTKTVAERLAGKNTMRPALPKRFYKAASVATLATAGSAARYGIQLDGRAVKTPKKRLLEVHNKAFADAIAAEWAAQDKLIDPATMPLTRIANTAIDAVADMMADVSADIAKFAGSDLLCYRAEGPQALVARQAAAWDPVLTWAHKDLGACFILAQGIVPVKQPPRSLEQIAKALESYDAFQLSSLHIITTLTGSALLALAFARGALTRDAVWACAHVDEDWQIEQWGEDEEAQVRRAGRAREFAAAAQVLEFAEFIPTRKKSE